MIPLSAVEDDDDEDDDNNDDDSNDPEWCMDEDRDSESGKRKLKSIDGEMDLVNGDVEAGHGGAVLESGKKASSKKLAKKVGRKCKDKSPSRVINLKKRKKNALGLKLAGKR